MIYYSGTYDGCKTHDFICIIYMYVDISCNNLLISFDRGAVNMYHNNSNDIKLIIDSH